MADLRRTPSIQHAVALMRDTVDATIFELEKLDRARIPFSLNPGRRMFKLMMEGQPLDWVTRQLRLGRPIDISPNVGLVEAFHPYACKKQVRWFRDCQPHGYPIGAGIIIPVRPAGFWSTNGKLHVLWPQCWKSRTLDNTQRAIFNTILRASFFVGDFKNANLEWVDLREQTPKSGRTIEIINGQELGTVTHGDLADYMKILVTAFEQHSATKAKQKAGEKTTKKPKDDSPGFFDETPPKSQ